MEGGGPLGAASGAAARAGGCSHGCRDRGEMRRIIRLRAPDER